LLETGQPFAGANALRVEIQTLGPNAWDVQTLGPTFTDLGSGRATTLTFRARAATAGPRVRFVMQSNVYRAQEFTLGTEWQEYGTSGTSPNFPAAVFASTQPPQRGTS